MEKIIYEFYSDLFDLHVDLSLHRLREDGYVILEVLLSEVRHVGKRAYGTQSGQIKTRTAEEHSASVLTNTVGDTLYTLSVGMQGS
ncbi:hypothetical protein RB195_006979 [Necator americanus]|uniref:Uncharacterized protein n=1 Tax=Necator americanus TaxID=51031 RepID=A0ABR1BXZ5_NECAM